MKKITVIAIAAATLLAGCGGSSDATETPAEPEATQPVDTDATQPADTTADDSGEATPTDASCGLTEEQIDDDDMVVLSSYLIDGDRLLCDPTDEALATFALYTGLIPAEYRVGIIGFVAIDQEASDGVDGAAQNVHDADGEPTGDRYLALDVTGASQELERTIVHEVGHTIFITAGSDVETGYAEDFNAAFPPGGSYEDAPDDFVTEYAASTDDGGEDMAESWAMYVYGDTPFAGDADDDGELDVVEPDTIAAEKVAFWSNYPELVELRDIIRASSGF